METLILFFHCFSWCPHVWIGRLNLEKYFTLLTTSSLTQASFFPQILLPWLCNTNNPHCVSKVKAIILNPQPMNSKLWVRYHRQKGRFHVQFISIYHKHLSKQPYLNNTKLLAKQRGRRVRSPGTAPIFTMAATESSRQKKTVYMDFLRSLPALVHGKGHCNDS